jgi:hypothetical protein
VIERLSACPVDVLVLGELERPADAFGLLRAIRSGQYPRIHPGQAVVTLGAGDELTVLRAYESGSDHHLPHGTGYRTDTPFRRHLSPPDRTAPIMNPV